MPAASFLSGLWPAAKEILRSFVMPDLGIRVSADLLTILLVFGVFLVVAGSLAASFAKGRAWAAVALAAGAATAGWVLFGGRHEGANFFVVITLVLGFLGGMTFVVGFFKTPWIPLALLVCILLAATGLVEAGILGLLLTLASSVLGAWSLFRRFEEYSPGRKGSRWNRRSAWGWVVCLLASGMLEAPGLGSFGRDFKIAGMVAGGAMLLLLRRPPPSEK